jgi:hypothetical protein
MQHVRQAQKLLGKGAGGGGGCKDLIVFPDPYLWPALCGALMV